MLFLLSGALTQGLHGQLDTAFLIGLEHLHANDLTFGQNVGDFIDSLVADLADVEQTIFTREQVHQCTEVKNFGDGAFIDLANFNLGCDLFNATLGFLRLGAIVGSDGDRAVVRC